MKVTIIRGGHQILIETNAPMQELTEHLYSEYLQDITLEEYLREKGYTAEQVNSGVTLNYDFIYGKG